MKAHGANMNYIQIALTTKCNLQCEYCPITEYRNTKPNWPMSNFDLIPFLQRAMEQYDLIPEENIIELTGGEPALYPDLDILLDFLTSSGFKVLIKTNGLLEIKPHDNVLRVAAFHNFDNPPKYYDVMLLIEETPNFEEKFIHCIDNNIKFETIRKDLKIGQDDYQGFKYTSFINPAGHNTGCQDDKAVENLNQDHTRDYGRIDNQINIKWRTICPMCKAGIDAWKFLKYFGDIDLPGINEPIDKTKLCDIPFCG